MNKCHNFCKNQLIISTAYSNIHYQKAQDQTLTLKLCEEPENRSRKAICGQGGRHDKNKSSRKCSGINSFINIDLH